MLPAINPGYGLLNMVEEMITRGPHIGIHYKEDNDEVWQMIRHVTHRGPGWS
jgi:ribosomal protein L30/L7E